MKFKKGFTLAELLIAMGITAVIAALMATTFSQVKPDKTKMLYLKGYDALAQSVKLLVNNSTIYNPVYKIGSNTYDVSSSPLLNLDVPLNTSFSNSSFSGVSKFGRLLADIMNGTDGTLDGQVYSFNSGPGKYHWTITPQGSALPASSGNLVSFNYRVDFNINGGNNFSFCVKSNGEILTMDDMGQTYINNRKNTRSRNDTSASAAATACSASFSISNPSPNFYVIGQEAFPNPNPPGGGSGSITEPIKDENEM